MGTHVCWAWVLSWQMAMGKISTFVAYNFTLPFFAAPNTSSETSCAKSFTCHRRAGVGHEYVTKSFIAVFKKPNTSSAPSSAAPGFRRLKMARAAMSTFSNNWRRRRWLWRRRRRRWWWRWW